LGKQWNEAIHPDEKARVWEECIRAIQQNRQYEFDCRFQHPNGEITWTHGCIAAEKDAQGGICGMVGAIMDVSEHRRLEREILEIGDREQRRISQDLHDDLCQFLAAIQYTAASLRSDLKDRPEAATANEITDLLKEAGVRTRKLSRGISPVHLDREGLVSALEELVDRSSRAFSIKCTLGCDWRCTIEDPSKATHLYRIAQEALHNAIRHGRATRVTISLSQSNGWITLLIQDDGIGIGDRPPEHHSGMGLRIMEYRSHMIGGSLRIAKNPGQGTSVSCSFREDPPAPTRDPHA